MSSDLPVSEVSSKTESCSAKRALSYDSDGGTIEDANVQNSTTTSEVENPSKRIKTEEVDGDTAEKITSGAIDTTDSVSTAIAPTEQTTCVDEINKGDNGADAGSCNDASDHNDTLESEDEIVESQTGKSPEPLPVASPAMTRSRSTSAEGGKENEAQDALPIKSEDPATSVEPKSRWRVHQMAEDYTSLVGSMMYPATQFQPYGYNPKERQYPIEKISLLGFIKSPLRRPTVIEKWSPYEIAVFEGSMLHYGKEFLSVSRQIGTKTTQEVIDFYYVWKKTAHYKKWKQQYISEDDLLDDYYVPLSPKKPKR